MSKSQLLETKATAKVLCSLQTFRLLRHESLTRHGMHSQEDRIKPPEIGDNLMEVPLLPHVDF